MTFNSQGESITLRATTQGILSSLNICVEILNQRDDYWKKKMENEVDKRRRSEDSCKYVELKEEREKKNIDLLEDNLLSFFIEKWKMTLKREKAQYFSVPIVK